MKKRLIALALTLALAFSVLPAAALAAKNSYTPGMFPDVDETSWYGDDGQGVIRGVYEAGLMIGTDGGRFGVGDKVTLAAAVTMASRAYSAAAADGYVFDQSVGDAWYDTYVLYAVEKGIIEAGDFFERDMAASPATRAEVAYMFANSLPGGFTEINTVEDGALPDVDKYTVYAGEIMLLYRAGVLTGNDDKGTFAPDTAISREQAAAILLRVSDPEKRAVKPPKRAGFDWSDYTSGMDVNTAGEWTTVAEEAAANLVTSYTLRVPQELYDEYFYDVYNDIGRCTVNSMYYPYDRRMEITVTYTVWDELVALAGNPALSSQISQEAARYDGMCTDLLSGIVSASMTEYEKVKAIHDYMIVNYHYDPGVAAGGDPMYGSEVYSFEGLLNTDYAVCQGYMELFYLLCVRSGIECRCVVGYAWNGYSGESHGWNAVTFSAEQYGGGTSYGAGTEYHVDVTWDDPIYGTDPYKDGATPVYDYFLLTSAEMSRDHREDLAVT